MKPEPPPYPRPVPSLDFDDYPILPGTTVYTNDGDLDETARAAKRRRIEANANAYLRGEGVFILSAGLRGPFDAGWKNPWATKTQKRKQVIEEESPAKRIHLLPNNGKQTRGPTTAVASNSKHQSEAQQENPFEKKIRSSEPPSHDEKVESWLRRTSALPPRSFAVPTSPTPKKRSSVAETNQSSKPMWTPTKQRIKVNSQDLRAPLQVVPSKVADSFDTIRPTGPRPARTHEKLQSILHTQEDAHPNHQSSDHDSRRRSRQIDHSIGQPIRAEEAIISLKRRSEEPIHKETSGQSLKQIAIQGIMQQITTKPLSGGLTALARSSESLPLVPDNNGTLETPTKETNRQHSSGNQGDAPEVKLKELDTSINEQLQENQPDDANGTLGVINPPATSGTSVPFHSTAVSDVQSTKLLPSAQHKPELQISTSNISSGALLPDVPAESEKNATLSRTLSKSKQKTVMDAVPPLSSGFQQTSDGVPEGAPVDLINGDNVDAGSMSSQKIIRRPAHGESTMQQQLIKSPVRDANNIVRMSQTSLDGSIVKSPTSTQRNKSNKKAKKASFAAEPSFNSSHGSIKSVLKVQKSDTMDRIQKLGPPSLSFSKSMDMDISVEEGRLLKDASNKRSSQNDSPIEQWKVPKSILKSKSAHSSAAATLASAMLSPKNRARNSFSRSCQEHQPSGQNEVLRRQEEEEFDIEGALDDLGSFLSTWDAEKEGVHAI